MPIKYLLLIITFDVFTIFILGKIINSNKINKVQKKINNNKPINNIKNLINNPDAEHRGITNLTT